MMFAWDNRRGLNSLERVFWVSDHGHFSYHRERIPGQINIFPAHVIYYTEETLKPLIQLLLNAGIPTTPTQLGLRPTDKDITSMWGAIQRDEQRIKTIGLILTNTETGEEETWYDKDFSFGLSKQTFIWSLVGQELGYAGFVLPKLAAEQIVTTLQDKMPPETSITLWKEVSPNIYAIGFENLSPHQEHTWAYITRLTRHYIIHQHPVPPEATR